MEKPLRYRRGITLTVIVLFISMGVIQSTGTNIKISNKETYSENSTICGYITDFETGEPIFEAQVVFFTEDYQGHYYDYEVLSDENGYYIVENVAAGNCIDYGAWATGYHMYFGYPNFEIPENETVWVNMSMYPLQPETSEVRGYVYDNYTGKPIFNLEIVMHWFDIYDLLNYNGSQTDENGYYSMNVGAGRFGVYTYTDDYIVLWYPIMYNVSDYELFWINFSLDPVITIKVLKPENGIYYKNKKIFPIKFPIIIGPIDIEFNVTLHEGYPIDHVEILIDGVSKQNYTTEPYIYHWDEKTPFRFRHTIKIIAHREYYNNRERELEVWKFF